MAAANVYIRLLGAFEVTIEQEAAIKQFPSRRSGELVQLLALTPGRRLMRDQVIDALWPHLDASAGGANLRKAAHHARQVLGQPDAIELHRQHVTLFPHAVVTTDVDEFLAAADEALAVGEQRAARAAAGRWSGELLPGARYESWAEDHRRLISARYLELLRAGGEWERVLEIDPLDEEAAREIMRGALLEGRRHRAIAVYGQIRSALAVELGVLPQTATDEIYADALVGLVPEDPAIVGRDHELAVIDGLLRMASSSLVLIRGAAGTGKSAFAQAVVERAQRGTDIAVLLRADAPDDAFALLSAIVEELWLRSPTAVEQLSERTRAILTRLTPVARSADALEMPLTRHQLIGAVCRLVEVAGQRVVLVIDDADQADISSLGVLAQLTEHPGAGPLVAFCFRPEGAGPQLLGTIGRTERRNAVTTIDLRPLDHDALRQLAVSLGAPADAEAVQMLAATSEGNAFFAYELCRAGIVGGEMPESLVDAIVRRFLDLDTDIIAWLRRLSLVDGPIELASAVALTGCTDDELSRLLDVGLARGVLIAHEGRYRFRHELVRRTLSDQLPPHHAVAVHRDAARRLAELGARPGAVAHHWLAGGRPERAVEWLLRAADDAVGLGGYPAAVEHLDRVIAFDADHVDALSRRAAALDAIGDPRAIAAYDDAARVASVEEVHELRPLQALAMVKLGDPAGGMRVVEGAEPKRLESRLAKALAYCGAGLMGHADPAIGARLAAEGRQLALRAGDPSAIMVAAWAQAGAAHAQGELRTSLQTDLHDTRSLPRLAVSVFDGQLCITQRLLYGSRPYDDVIRWADAFAVEAHRLGALRGHAFATTLRGEAELLSGRLDDAERHLGHGRQLHHTLGAAAGESFSLQRLAELAGVRGDQRLAMRLLDESLAVARESDVGFHLFDRIYGARIALARDPAEAVAAVDEAEELVVGPLETCPGCRITLAVPAAIALAKAGQLDRLEAYETSCQWLAQVVMQLPAWYAALDEVRGHRSAAQGDGPASRDHFSAALDGFRRAGQPHDVARCEQLIAAVRV
ncbi:MAG TPA: AAA family ATPase [Ilumatobacter sp.]|nr:AAA family ATPase [Ilumatobacter sp.]